MQQVIRRHDVSWVPIQGYWLLIVWRFLFRTSWNFWKAARNKLLRTCSFIKISGIANLTMIWRTTRLILSEPKRNIPRSWSKCYANLFEWKQFPLTTQSEFGVAVDVVCGNIVDRDMVWKLGRLQSAYNELRFDVGTVLTVHKYFVFRLFKQHVWAIKPKRYYWIIPSLY